MLVRVKIIDPMADLPTWGSNGAAAFDIKSIESKVLLPGHPQVFRTGLQFEVPPGHVMLVFSRSGMGFNQNVRLANSVGVIDSDYRGELFVKLTMDPSPNKKSGEGLMINYQDRIAQAIILPIPVVYLTEVSELSETDRGEGGLGSTGT